MTQEELKLVADFKAKHGWVMSHGYIQYLPWANGATTRAITNVTNAVPEMVRVLSELVRDGECYCPENVAYKGVCAWCQASSLLGGPPKEKPWRPYLVEMASCGDHCGTALVVSQAQNVTELPDPKDMAVALGMDACMGQYMDYYPATPIEVGHKG